MARKRRRYNRRNRSTNDNKLLYRAGLIVGSLVIIFFGIKLLLYPIMGVAANLLKESTASFSNLVTQEKVKQDNGQTNILLLGVDERYKGGTSLTDTIIVASYDHETQSTTLLSLPRDLWVTIPAFDQVNSYSTKINAVYSIGEEYAYTGSNKDPVGGVGLLSAVLDDHLGVPIHYYAKINFDGFRQVIDAIGGVDVYVERAFTDYQYPREGYENAPWSSRFEVVSFEQGWQHMDGETALKYARSRHALGPEGSDFARADRQQKVILAIKDKVTSNETLFNPTYLKNLYMTVSSEFETNIGLVELPLFYNLAQKFEGGETIDKYVLTNGVDSEAGLLYSPDPAQYGGAYVLVPREGWEDVQRFVSEAFSGTLTVEPTTDAEDNVE